MREVVFRGKSLETGEWVYGSLYTHAAPLECFGCNPLKQTYFIYKAGFADWSMPRPVESHEVDRKTIGQCTGIKDRNSQLIFEGDIIKWEVSGVERTAVVYYDQYQACFWMGLDLISGNLVLNDWMRGEYEKLGNKIDNPEILPFHQHDVL